MAKKSTATRQAARRPQTTSKQPSVALVRTQRPEGGAPSRPAATNTSGARTVKPAGQSTAAPRPATTKPEEQAIKSVSPVTPESVPAKAAAPRRLVVAPGERPRAPEVKSTRPAAPKAESAMARQQQVTRAQAARVARARATQRARSANVITPEHYGYVRQDLRLIATLAVGMFAIIIILHFVLPQ
jgi:hypothetical protein